MHRDDQLLDARLAELQAAGKPVFVNFTAAWCLSCLVNEKVALNTAAVQQALEQHRGNISRAARSLGLHRSTLHRRLKEMSLLITADGHHPESPESAWQ